MWTRKIVKKSNCTAISKTAGRTNLPGCPDADRKVKIACTLGTGETAFRALQFRNVSSFRPPRLYVRLWLIGDIQPPSDLRPLCPRKRTFLEAAQKVRFCPEADIWWLVHFGADLVLIRDCFTHRDAQSLYCMKFCHCSLTRTRLVTCCINYLLLLAWIMTSTKKGCDLIFVTTETPPEMMEIHSRAVPYINKLVRPMHPIK